VLAAAHQVLAAADQMLAGADQVLGRRPEEWRRGGRKSDGEREASCEIEMKGGMS
jgi:hypothetical protein